MLLNHNGYLSYKVPKTWCTEENEDNLFIYDPNGKGAITASFFSLLTDEASLDVKVSVMAKQFIDENHIRLNSAMILCNKDDKTVLSGTGTTVDGEFIKFWYVAKQPKIVFATYLSEQKNAEIKICDSIIDSFKFDF